MEGGVRRRRHHVLHDSAAEERAAIAERYKWNLAEIYPSEEAWERERGALADDLTKLAARKRTLPLRGRSLIRRWRSATGSRSAPVAPVGLRQYAARPRYARRAQSADDGAGARGFAPFSPPRRWIRPELLALGAEKVRAFIADDERLKPYRQPLDDTLRFGPHTLDAQGEELLAQVGTDRRCRRGGVVDLHERRPALADGDAFQRADGPASMRPRTSNGANRRIATTASKSFVPFGVAYGQFTRTLGTTLNAQIQSHVFRQKARKYGSSLRGRAVPRQHPASSVYTQLDRRRAPRAADAAPLSQAAPADARARAPALRGPVRADRRAITSATFTPEEATALVLRAVAPLGATMYASARGRAARAALDGLVSVDGQAVGRVQHDGLRAASVPAPEFHRANTTEVSTLAHESGHSMHSYLAATRAAVRDCALPDFHRRGRVDAQREPADPHDARRTPGPTTSGCFCSAASSTTLRRTLFRQMLFAEFELRIHESAEKGEPLTGENLKRLYLDLLRTYYGHDAGVCEVDELYANEWAFVPHFYYDFYVFQYATSIVASMSLAERHPERGARSPGGATAARRLSADAVARARRGTPYDMLKDAGVDIATSAPFDAAMREMNAMMDRIEALHRANAIAERGAQARTSSPAPPDGAEARQRLSRRMFSKILIANRGEIACRVARTARRLGVGTVAVYSDADARAMHVEVCDEAYRLGPPPPRASYLDGDAIIAIARRTGAQAIHPGYGFLSENADFAAACANAGIVFIGPPVAAIAAMGSKSAAKALMQNAGVPVVPGYHGDDQDPALLASEAQKIGFPVLIKATAGGGGKGMKVVSGLDAFAAALASARREAKASYRTDNCDGNHNIDHDTHAPRTGCVPEKQDARQHQRCELHCEETSVIRIDTDCIPRRKGYSGRWRFRPPDLDGLKKGKNHQGGDRKNYRPTILNPFVT